ncbi:metallophosphoesterase family protein, partial [Bacillus anthracis]|uniref:metallophosphoesterase family protein n=1 Tax=Bacillus anthracis TaxID=1392 RepID=UPI000D3D22E7
MYILQLSDLHIGIDIDLDEFKSKIDKIYEEVNKIIEKSELLIFCICGDVTDKGNKDGYKNATIVIDYLKEKFTDYNHKLEFIPGNHDICEEKFEEFDKFIAGYIDEKYSYEDKNVVVRNYGDINLVLLNSSYHKNHEYGKIDLVQLRSELKENENNFVIMHHTFISEYDDDKSAIRNAYIFIKALDENNVCALLHGHTHGYSDISISKECKDIGAGPLFKKLEDINNQFNIIEIKAGKVNRVYNMRYSSDLGTYSVIDVYSRKNLNNFYGNSLIEVYNDVVESTREHGAIINFNMNIRSDLNTFNNDVQTIFHNQINIAEEWQEETPPSTLYYNHGQYMFKGKVDPIEYVINELKDKATSSRAIIPLINMEDVVGSGDNFLPSLDIIQFGFKEDNKEELYVTLYLRALEVNNFLKINLSEVYVMCKKIRERIREISILNITIFSFKAQYREKYSCFRKADIDMIDESDLMMSVVEKDINTIISLLENKHELSETVVHLDGVEKLERCIKNYNKRKKEVYSEDICN